MRDREKYYALKCTGQLNKNSKHSALDSAVQEAFDQTGETV